MNPELRIDDLGPPDFKSNARFEKPVTVKLTLPAEMHAWNIRTGESLGKQKQLSVTVDPFEPAIFGFSESPMHEMSIAAPANAKRGTTCAVGISFRPDTQADLHVLHVEAIDTSGKPAAAYSGNLRAARGSAIWTLPLALNDAAGAWQLRIRDALTGQSRTATLQVE